MGSDELTEDFEYNMRDLGTFSTVSINSPPQEIEFVKKKNKMSNKVRRRGVDSVRIVNGPTGIMSYRGERGRSMGKNSLFGFVNSSRKRRSAAKFDLSMNIKSTRRTQNLNMLSTKRMPSSKLKKNNFLESSIKRSEDLNQARASLDFLDEDGHVLEARNKLNQLFSYIKGEVLTRMKSLKLRQRLIMVSDKKRLEYEIKKQKKFEEIYGKKTEMMFEKKQRETINVYKSRDLWEKICRIFLKNRRNMYIHLELAMFSKSFVYSKKLFMGKWSFSKKSKVIPMMSYEREAVDSKNNLFVFYRIKKSFLTDQINLIKYVRYTVELENLVCNYLFKINDRCTSCDKIFKAHYLNHVSEAVEPIKRFKKKIVALKKEWNMAFLKGKFSDFKFENGVKIRLKEYVHGRIDAQLLDLKIARMFFNCYDSTKNTEKGYLILSMAFEANKMAVDIFLDLYIKYHSEKRLMTHFLEEKELSMPKGVVWKIRSVFEWCEIFKDLGERNRYIAYIIKYLENYMNVAQIKEILQILAEKAVKTCHFHQAERYYETLLYIYDSIDKLDLIHVQESKKYRFKKNKRILEILKLNKKFMTINNELVRITNKNHSFEKSLNYISNNYFIYHNSVEMINDTDPNKYAKKNMNKIILQDKNEYLRNINVKNEFQSFLNLFNIEFKKTLVYYEELWMIVNKKFSLVTPELYNSIKNCLEILKKMNSFNKKNLMLFISKYFPIPRLDEKSVKPSYWMEIYFPTYTGFVDTGQFEQRIITKLHFTYLKRSSNTTMKKFQFDFQRETASSKNKRERRLNNVDVNTYYSMKSEHPKVIQILLAQCLYKSFASSSPNAVYGIYDRYYSGISDEEFYNMRLRESSDRSLNLIYRNMRKFQRRFRKYIRRKKAKQSKIETKSQIGIIDRFKMNLPRDKTNTLNILAFFKNKPLKKTYHRPSKFCENYKKNIEQIQDRYGLYQLDFRKSRVEDTPEYRRRHSLGYIHNPYSVKERDKFNICGLRKDHFFNVNLIKKREEEKLKLHYKIEGKKEEGNYVHIEDSVKEINRTNFMMISRVFRSNYYLSNSFKISNDSIDILLKVNSHRSSNTFEIGFFMDLHDTLPNCKEEIVKMSRIKFQSYWPIMHKLFGENRFKLIMEQFDRKKDYFNDKDQLVHDSLMDNMAFAFPIILTKLNTYPKVTVERFNLTYFSKYDLDAVQCLLNMTKFLQNIIIFSSRITNYYKNGPDFKINFIKFCELIIGGNIEDAISQRLGKRKAIKNLLSGFMNKNSSSLQIAQKYTRIASPKRDNSTNGK